MERIPRLRNDVGAEHQPLVGVFERLVDTEAQQAVAGIAELGLADRQLQVVAVEGVLPVADAVRPRHEHDPGCRGRRGVVGVGGHELNALDGQSAEGGADLGDLDGGVGAAQAEALASGVGGHDEAFRERDGRCSQGRSRRVTQGSTA